MNPSKLTSQLQNVKSMITRIDHQLRGIKGLRDESKTSLDHFRSMFIDDMNCLIKDALKNCEPKTAEEIIKEINKTEELTPQLLKGIRDLLKESENKNKKSAKTTKDKK